MSSKLCQLTLMCLYHCCLQIVCTRVLRGARDSAKQSQIGVVEALEDYCKLQNINVEDQKFCYNIDTMKSDINRLLRLGADDDRICKKVKAVNPHFCLSKTAKSEDTTAAYVPSRTKRGIIYI